MTMLSQEQIAEAFNRTLGTPNVWGYQYRIQDVPSPTDNDIGTIRYLWVYFVNDQGEKISNVVKSGVYFWFKDKPNPKHKTRKQAKKEAYDNLTYFMNNIWHFQGPDLPTLKTLEQHND